VKGSQWLHRDSGDPDNVKCFINITNIDSTNGPLHILPRKQSRKLLWNTRSITGIRKFPDHIVNSYIEKNTFLTNIGKAGSGLFADTSKCFHFGGRVEKDMRAMLVMHYSRFTFGQKRLPREELRKQYATNKIKNILLEVDR